MFPAVNPTEAAPKFVQGEKVLCFHGPLIYEAKCLNRNIITPNLIRYLIHYAGWNKNWDEWVPESRVMKYNKTNIKKQRKVQVAHAAKLRRIKKAQAKARKSGVEMECSKETGRPDTQAPIKRRKTGIEVAPSSDETGAFAAPAPTKRRKSGVEVAPSSDETGAFAAPAPTKGRDSDVEVVPPSDETEAIAAPAPTKGLNSDVEVVPPSDETEAIAAPAPTNRRESDVEVVPPSDKTEAIAASAPTKRRKSGVEVALPYNEKALPAAPAPTKGKGRKSDVEVETELPAAPAPTKRRKSDVEVALPSDKKALPATPAPTKGCKSDVEVALPSNETELPAAPAPTKRRKSGVEVAPLSDETVLPAAPGKGREIAKPVAATAKATKRRLKNTPRKSGSGQPKRKRGRFVSPVETEGRGFSRNELKIIIPVELRDSLVDDWDLIIRQFKVPTVPASINVEKIMDNYMSAMRSDAFHNAARETTFKDMTTGLKEYFNVVLGSQLLYKFERPLYGDILKEYPGTPMSQIYGGIHLLRLMAKLGSMAAYVSLDERALQHLTVHIQDLIKYMVVNKKTLLNLRDYDNTTPEYHRSV